jgi:predicted RNA-binding Zn-ribbon protein involved in translation (DUF1610 family)
MTICPAAEPGDANPVSDETIRSPDETIFVARRRRRETEVCSDDVDQTMGCDHVCVHTQLNLPRNSQDLPLWNAQAHTRLMGLRRGFPRSDKRLRRDARLQMMTTVIFACPKCGLAHEVRQVYVPTEESGRFDCADCGARIHSWKGVFNYAGCKPVRLGRGAGKTVFINPATFSGLRRSGLSKPGRRH